MFMLCLVLVSGSEEPFVEVLLFSRSAETIVNFEASSCWKASRRWFSKKVWIVFHATLSGGDILFASSCNFFFTAVTKVFAGFLCDCFPWKWKQKSVEARKAFSPARRGKRGQPLPLLRLPLWCHHIVCDTRVLWLTSLILHLNHTSSSDAHILSNWCYP